MSLAGFYEICAKEFGLQKVLHFDDDDDDDPNAITTDSQKYVIL